MHGSGDDIIILSVHVDDTNILSPSLRKVEWLKKIIDGEFSIEDFSPTSYFLGKEVVRDREKKTLEMHQQEYSRLSLNRTAGEMTQSSIKREFGNALSNFGRLSLIWSVEPFQPKFDLPRFRQKRVRQQIWVRQRVQRFLLDTGLEAEGEVECCRSTSP